MAGATASAASTSCAMVQVRSATPMAFAGVVRRASPNQSPAALFSVMPGTKSERTANHGQGALAANLGRHHHLRRLGCYRHNRQRLALGLDADGSVSTPNRIHQPLWFDEGHRRLVARFIQIEG